MVGPDLRYTAHAFERMTERDISRATVEAVVMAGAVEVERCVVCRYTLEGLVVVVDGRDVVTAYYYDSDLRQRGDWNPKKKQRKGQEKRRRLKPQYIKGRGHINTRQQAYYQQQMEGR